MIGIRNITKTRKTAGGFKNKERKETKQTKTKINDTLNN